MMKQRKNIEEYKEAIRIDPNNYDAHYNLGNLLYDLKRYEEAEKEFREAIRIDPNLAGVLYNLGLLLLLKEFRELKKI